VSRAAGGLRAAGRRPAVLGVVGAGTMGAGICQLGCAAGMTVLLHDPLEDALGRGAERVRSGLRKWIEKGRAGGDSLDRLRPAASLDELRGCELVIEAAPERADLKRELFASLSEVCGPETVLATNTSSIPVTSLAGAAVRPENVVGMHFFNPPPLMKLLEVIRADQTGAAALEVARATGEAMGKQVIVAADGPGFLVNRCGRPFAGEALRLLQERVASHEQIDRICRMGGGFRMGPFELMDLVGVDVGYAVARSFTELSFGEARWKPSPIQARMVDAGRLGRKTGRGYYDYTGDGPYRPEDPEPAPAGWAGGLAGGAGGLAGGAGGRPVAAGGRAVAAGGAGRLVAILGAGRLADELRERARGAGYDLRDGGPAELVVDAGTEPAASVPGGAPLLVLCAARSLAARGEPGAIGFHLLPPLGECRLVELTRLPASQPFAAEAAEVFFARLGFAAEWVGDAPGLVLGRIVCQLVNEACFAVGEGVGGEKDVDAGLTLGLNHPRGPFAWCEAIGVEHVCATIDALWRERREERYRLAPLLQRRAMLAGWRPPT
jgi:3-hydroxybutyryl-CoA dehydrogenase